jgi:hypothetical protein
MHTASVTQTSAAILQPPPTRSSATQSSARATASQPTPLDVWVAALKAANSDGDGRTGSTAALKDGDAAAQAARRRAINIGA